ncbi:MAG: glycosyltransferase family 9 protein [Hyphomicrobiales bacterium]
MENKNRIIISRTDAIGDVILTLPMCGWIKKNIPDAYIIFLGQKYTSPIISCSKYVDEVIEWDHQTEGDAGKQVSLLSSLNADIIIHVFPKSAIAKAAKKAKIPFRIGTSGRLYHYLTCNKLLKFSRKKSDLHEGQLNFKLLSPLGFNGTIETTELNSLYGFNSSYELNKEITDLIDKSKFNIILHPKSKGSAREWGITNFVELMNLLPQDKYKIFVSGTEDEGKLIKANTTLPSHVIDITGKLSLNEFISFINHCDGLIAASTGPLHIAAALQKVAIGIYPPIRPMHPGRWAPIGSKASFLVKEKECNTCRKEGACQCMLSISPQEVFEKLDSLNK